MRFDAMMKSLPGFAFMAAMALLLWAGPVHAQDGGERQQPQLNAPAARPSPDGLTTQPAPEPSSQPAQEPAREQAAPAVRTAIPELADTEAGLDAIRLRIDVVESALKRDTLTDTELAALRDELGQPQTQTLEIEDAIQPRIQAIQARLRQLGPAPEKDTPAESDEIARERAFNNETLTLYQGIAARAGLLKVRAEQVQRQISERRRTLFADRIFERRDSALNPSLWIDAVKALPVWVTRFSLLLNEGAGSIVEKIDLRASLAIAGTLGFLALLIFPVRRLLLHFGARDPALIQPGPLRKSSAAAWLVLVYALVPLAALSFLLFVLNALQVLPMRIERLANAFTEAVFIFALVEGLAWALIAPSRPSWRLLELSDRAARRLHRLIILAGAIYAADNFMAELDRVLFAPVSSVIGRDTLTSLILAGLTAACLRAVTGDRAQAGRVPAASASFRWNWLKVPAWLVIASVPLASIFGYLSLANFLSSQLIVAAVILAALALTLRFTDDALTWGLEGEQGMADTISRATGLTRETVVQGGVLLSGLIRVMLLVVAIFFLLIPWGIESRDVLGWFHSAFFGFSIGEIRISPSTVLIGLGIFLLGLAATRIIQNWLRNRFLPQTRLDTGVRNSLSTAFGYLGMIGAVVIAFTFVGLDLSNLALVAGALGVGIGFGLQSIVNNFVSGLILLAERPIKAGDWIVVGAEQGYVRKISVRSTEIETFDQATVIVPNSDLISGVVKNWMHGSRNGRITINVSVAYDSDPDQVRSVLLECAENHPAILRDPAPKVFFMDFGASSLDFELRAHLGDVDFGLSVRSDLRFAIFAALKKAGIEIPYPQHDVHLRDMARLEKLFGKRQAESGNGQGSSSVRAPARRKARKPPSPA